jgi:sulfonate transport system substrate-binding protein
MKPFTCVFHTRKSVSTASVAAGRLPDRRGFLGWLGIAAGAVLMTAATTLPAGSAQAEEAPDAIGIDYAYYNPVSLLLKEKGWLEEALAGEGIEVRWILSLGSNKALEFLRGGSLDFGSTAGAASVIGRANGLPIKAVYVYSKPEWTALVTTPDSGIVSVADLKGKTVAVTRGTDPHIFLLRALDAAGLTERDIKPVLLQHPDGYTALSKGQVDAWAGLDPHMAKGELEGNARLFYRNADLNTYGILNVREEFAEDHPRLVAKVLSVYERARQYALAHPDELQAALIEAARIDAAVAERQLGQRTDITDPVLGTAHRETFLAAGAILQEIGIIRDDVDIAATVEALVDPSFLAAAAGQ